jgi:hypothetical protein
VLGCLEHTRGHRGGGEEDIEKQLLPRSEGFQVVFILPDLVHLSFELASKPGVEAAIGGAHQQWIFVGSDAALGGGRRAVSFGDYPAHRLGKLAVFLPPLLFWLNGNLISS